MGVDRTAQWWTTTEVLSDVRRKASLPATSTDWTDAVILREATDVLWSFAGWAIAQGGEGRMLASLDRPVTSALSGVFGKNEFLIPPLAVGAAIENVTWIDAEGRTQARLARVDHAEESVWAGITESGSPGMYTLLGDRIRVYPTPTTGGTVRITYPRRHSELVVAGPSTAVALTGLTQVTPTTTSFVSAHNMLSPGDALDILSSNYPYAPIIASVELLTQVGMVVTIAAPYALLAGHPTPPYPMVVKAGVTPYVSLPLELRAAFNEKVCANILRVVGDLSGSAACEQAAGLELSRAMMLLSPRAKRDKPYVVNPFSHLRLAARWRR